MNAWLPANREITNPEQKNLTLSLSPVEKVEAFELLFASPSFIQKFIEIRRTYQTIHPWSFTRPLEIGHPKGNFIFQRSCCRGANVGFREGDWKFLQITKVDGVPVLVGKRLHVFFFGAAFFDESAGLTGRRLLTKQLKVSCNRRPGVSALRSNPHPLDDMERVRFTVAN